MSYQQNDGPLVISGQQPATQAGSPPPDYNPDAAPSLFAYGLGMLDIRYGAQGSGVGEGSPAAYGFAPGVNYAVIDQVPSAIATANIAALANVTGVAMTLVSATGAGITVMTASLFIPQTGKTVPACLAIDGLPGNLTFTSPNKSVAIADPTKAISRAVSISGVGSGAGGAFKVVGYDLYGNLIHETITVGAGANTVNGKKAFKFIQSVTPQFTDAHNYSVGTTDIYGLPLRADSYGYVNATFNNAPVTSPTFVAAVITTGTATSGDVRGTIVAPSASDGTKRLQVMQGIPPANTLSVSGNFGVSQFIG